MLDDERVWRREALPELRDCCVEQRRFPRPSVANDDESLRDVVDNILPDTLKVTFNVLWQRNAFSTLPRPSVRHRELGVRKHLGLEGARRRRERRAQHLREVLLHQLRQHLRLRVPLLPHEPGIPQPLPQLLQLRSTPRSLCLEMPGDRLRKSFDKRRVPTVDHRPPWRRVCPWDCPWLLSAVERRVRRRELEDGAVAPRFRAVRYHPPVLDRLGCPQLLADVVAVALREEHERHVCVLDFAAGGVEEVGGCERRVLLAKQPVP
mmetsp:Transcript_47027/g.112017  ORF Transcript_47027/g.112017 Transcript_47027/m.112017 type:complete len:264 (+) Transcript_47027:1947-2738(+)